MDTRFGAQNPGLGNAGKCFVDAQGIVVPFSQLHHAGEDWFALNADRHVIIGETTGQPVRAVAHGSVSYVYLMGYDGYVLIVKHVLPTSDALWSVYWHVAAVQVAQGQAVTQGQTLAFIQDRGLNSHLHWEMRTFADGSAPFPPESAGGRGTCNGHIPGVSYTWANIEAQAKPEVWGYLPPTAFVNGFDD